MRRFLLPVLATIPLLISACGGEPRPAGLASADTPTTVTPTTAPPTTATPTTAASTTTASTTEPSATPESPDAVQDVHVNEHGIGLIDLSNSTQPCQDLADAVLAPADERTEEADKALVLASLADIDAEAAAAMQDILAADTTTFDSNEAGRLIATIDDTTFEECGFPLFESATPVIWKFCSVAPAIDADPEDFEPGCDEPRHPEYLPCFVPNGVEADQSLYADRYTRVSCLDPEIQIAFGYDGWTETDGLSASEKFEAVADTIN